MDHVRLRQGLKIVGFAKRNPEGHLVYSQDGNWWHSHSIEFDLQDRAVGLQDRNRKEIFENDIIQWRTDPRVKLYRQGVVLFKSKEEGFVLRDIRNHDVYPLFIGGEPLFDRDDLSFVSYLFINPQLKKILNEEASS